MERMKMSEVPCPNCRKDGDAFDTREYKHYCDDEACPVITYDWNGKYSDTSNSPDGSENGGGSEQ